MLELLSFIYPITQQTFTEDLPCAKDRDENRDKRNVEFLNFPFSRRQRVKKMNTLKDDGHTRNTFFGQQECRGVGVKLQNKAEQGGLPVGGGT